MTQIVNTPDGIVARDDIIDNGSRSYRLGYRDDWVYSIGSKGPWIVCQPLEVPSEIFFKVINFKIALLGEDVQRAGRVFNKTGNGEYLTMNIGDGDFLVNKKEHYGEMIHDLYSTMGYFMEMKEKRKEL